MAISNRLKSVKAWLGLLALVCALFSLSCANDDFSDDSSQQHEHHGGGGRQYGGGQYGHGQGGMYDQSSPFGSSSPAPRQ
jgi:Spy/CpxP family protein refolding chaperone